MLVLTRKYQEKIRIGNNITITVLRMKGKAVRLGIEAPADVPVIRGELSFASEGGTEAHEDAATHSSDTARNGRTIGRAAGMDAQWETSSRPEAPGLGPRREPVATVAFSRVSRDNVANLLPKLVAGPAPLRALMDRGRS